MTATRNLISLLALATGGAAQAPIVTHQGVLPVAGTTSDHDPLSVPPPPKAVFAPQAPKATPALALRPGAAPELAPGAATVPGNETGAGPLGGSLVFQENRVVAPVGASLSDTNEPATAIHRDTAFFTGNWFAALSTSEGRSWTHVNPYTTFPAADGGFCCDQLVHYIPGDDSNCLMVWVLQYSFSATSNTNRHRIAIARGRDALRNSTFYYYDVVPSLAGYPAGTWADFPHVAHSNGWLFLAANVFNASSVFQGTQVIRLSLADLRAGNPANYNAAATPPRGNPGSLRLAEGCTTTMYYGAHWTNILGGPVIRIFDWPDALTTPTTRDIGVSQWYGGASTSTGPDGRNWLTGDDHRITGCYFANGALSFLWGSNAGGSFPQPFVRIAGFSPATGYNLIGEASVWNPTIAWAYPSAAVNAASNIGGTLCFGGGGLHPSSAAFVVDALSGWAPLTNVPFATGARGPSSRFGDYLWARRHPSYPNTYVGTGYALDAAGNAVPRFGWFGRQNDLPQDLQVIVSSYPVLGVPIAIDVPDRNGNRDGVTQFARNYPGNQGMTFSAPAQFVSGGTHYTFDRWRNGATFYPVGQRDLVIPDLGGAGTTVEARYTRVRHVLTVTATPSNGPAFTLTPLDFNGAGGGFTPTTIEYEDNAQFRITASIAFNGAIFDRWVVDGVPQAPGALSLDWVARAPHALVMTYRTPVCGGFTAYGQSCNSRNIFLPFSHTASTARTPCGPYYGDTATYSVVNGFTNAAGVLMFGVSRTSFNGIPLPLPVPGQAGCFIYTDLLSFFSFGVDGAGNGGMNIPIPLDRNLANARFYTQCLVVTGLGAVQWSNGIETLVGGLP